MALWHYGTMALWQYVAHARLHHGEDVPVPLWHYCTMALWHYATMALWQYLAYPRVHHGGDVNMAQCHYGTMAPCHYITMLAELSSSAGNLVNPLSMLAQVRAHQGARRSRVMLTVE